jgi:thioredoxin-related protein
MRRSVMLFLAALLVFAGIVGCKGGQKSSGAAAGKDLAPKNWLPYNAGMARAAKEKKKAIIDFYASWCRWCKVMDRETFSNPAVGKYLSENFITIRIDAENNADSIMYQGKRYTPASLARNFGVRGYPSLAYLDEDGDLIQVVPGYMQADRFLPLLQYMHGGYYKRNITFDEFLRRRSAGDTSVAR